jgi:hypothetical protein
MDNNILGNILDKMRENTRISKAINYRPEIDPISLVPEFFINKKGGINWFTFFTINEKWHLLFHNYKIHTISLAANVVGIYPFLSMEFKKEK